MLAFDIVLAFHQAPEEIGECAASILKSDYDLKKVYLHSRAAGAEVNTQYGAVFGGVDVGNAQPDRGAAPYILFLNAEARVYPDTLNMLSRRIG